MESMGENQKEAICYTITNCHHLAFSAKKVIWQQKIQELLRAWD